MRNLMDKLGAIVLLLIVIFASASGIYLMVNTGNPQRAEEVSMNKDESVEELKDRIQGKPEYIAETIYAKVINQLSREMEEREISKFDLTSRTDLTSGEVDRFLSDRDNFSLLKLAKIAKALDLDWYIGLETKVDK